MFCLLVQFEPAIPSLFLSHSHAATSYVGGVRVNHLTPQVLPEYSLHIGYLVNTNLADVNDIH